jgi:hypothetical protein
MKVILLNCALNPLLTDYFIKIIEGIADEAFKDAVVNTSIVHKENADYVQQILRESYSEEDYDVFIYAEDYTDKKDEAIYDIKDICLVHSDDIIYIEPSDKYEDYEKVRTFIMNNGEQN